MQHLEDTVPWRKRPEVGNLDSLLALARDRTRAGRENLASAVGDLFGTESGTLNKSEQAIMYDILSKLVRDVETTVRQKLAQKLSGVDTAPHELIIELANDQIEVSLPVLQRSDVLRDSELIEIIHHRTMEHQLAISMRPEVSEPVSDALVETNNPVIIATLLQNHGSKMSVKALARLVDHSEREEAYRKPLLKRRELSQEMAQKMYWWVSAALRQDIMSRYKLCPDDFDVAMESAVQDSLHESGHAVRPADDSLTSLLTLDEVAQHRMVKALREGKIPMFQSILSQASGLPLPEIRRIMFEAGGENLAIACRSINLAPNVFAAIYRLLRSGGRSEESLPSGDLTRVTSLYLDVNPDHAKAVTRQWRRNPNYAAAIQQISTGSSSIG
ncbi:MAG: DUF2336 domain-containing protein [Alphaproteobacteria bacterium]